MPNDSLAGAKSAKNDEFYTQYADIQNEVNAFVEYNPDVFRDKVILLPCDDPEWSNFTKFFAQNFERYGIRKLISTSYAYDSKNKQFRGNYQITMFEQQAVHFDETKTQSHGKIFTLTRDKNTSGILNINDLEWEYLEGDGDFRSAEVTMLRDEADIIITNPPFSMFREFLAWIMKANKKFLIIGSKNVITYKEVFPLIKENKIWLGEEFQNGDAYFKILEPDNREWASGVFDSDTNIVKFRNVGWFTNLDLGRRHEYLKLMSEADNIKFSRHKGIKNIGYHKYDNYDAIEVPYTDAIPSDYDGAMGVPITFLDKYNPDQFEIIWQASGNTYANAPKHILEELKFDPSVKYGGGLGAAVINGKAVYSRIFIKKKGL